MCRPIPSAKVIDDNATMASVDAAVNAPIARPPPLVAAHRCDPDNATSWYANVDSVRWETAKPMSVGSQFTFLARFLGRRLNGWEDARMAPRRCGFATEVSPRACRESRRRRG